MSSIVACELTKSFQGKSVLKDISFEVEEGEIFGLLGPSGAGKTTLIKILTGQLLQDVGSAYLLGDDCNKLSQSAYSQIGMLMDTSGVYERLSCYDNLLLFTRLYGVSKERIKEVLAQVGLSEALKVPAGKLSKGMKSRLALGRALLHKPKLLFLDEPTSGLDPRTARRIHELLRSLQKEGMTIFLTTHQMEEAHKLCNHIILLYEGRIVEAGEPEVLCRKYNKQNKINVRLKNGEVLELENNASSAALIAGYMKEGQLETIHSTEPHLEEVFMTLTGRGLA